MKARPRGGFRAAIVLALLLGAVPSAWGSTRGVRVEPFAADGSLAAGWKTTAKISGSCFAGAISTQRSDAFRCFAGTSTIVDPCFSSPAGKAEVLCVLAPGSRDAIDIRLTKPLPAAGHGPGQGVGGRARERRSLQRLDRSQRRLARPGRRLVLHEWRSRRAAPPGQDVVGLVAAERPRSVEARQDPDGVPLARSAKAARASATSFSASSRPFHPSTTTFFPGSRSL